MSTHTSFCRARLLIDGYIRIIQTIFTKYRRKFNHIIPIGINKICFTYYKIPKLIFIHQSANFHILDVTDVTNVKLIPNYLQTTYEKNTNRLKWSSPPFCFIKNIDKAPIGKLTNYHKSIRNVIFSKMTQWNQDSAEFEKRIYSFKYLQIVPTK